MEAEARVEKEALEERLHAGELKLTVARRERNALLAALRDFQRRGRVDPDTLSPFTPPEVETLHGRKGGRDRNEANGSGAGINGGSAVGAAIGGKMALAVGSDGHISCKEGVVKVVETSAGNQLTLAGEGKGGDGMPGSCSDGRSITGDMKGAEEGVGSGHGSRAAALSARLEMLALQTRQLLVDNDTSCSSDEDSDSD